MEAWQGKARDGAPRAGHGGQPLFSAKPGSLFSQIGEVFH
jgi:hypothetical protein